MVKGIYICKTNIDKADKEQSELLMGIMNFSKQTKSKKDKKKGAKKDTFQNEFPFFEGIGIFYHEDDDELFLWDGWPTKGV